MEASQHIGKLIIMNDIKSLIKEIGPGKNISLSAYDTAWLARLDDQAPDLCTSFGMVVCKPE